MISLHRKLSEVILLIENLLWSVIICLTKETCWGALRRLYGEGLVGFTDLFCWGKPSSLDFLFEPLIIIHMSTLFEEDILEETLVLFMNLS